MRRFELEPFLANIEKFSVNEIGIVPPIVIAIVMSGLGKKYSLASLKAVSVGAAPLGKASQDRMRDLLEPGVSVNQVWGMTEMSWYVKLAERSLLYYGFLIAKTKVRMSRSLGDYDHSRER
jgi:non-ribosomal peptide synthetase component E (peptide arylation enzyme)